MTTKDDKAGKIEVVTEREKSTAQDMLPLARAVAAKQYMVKGKVMEVEDAVKLIRSGDTITFTGIANVLVPEKVLSALEVRFLTEGEPRNLTLAYPLCSGCGPNNGADHLAHEGLTGKIMGANYYPDMYPELHKLIVEDRIPTCMFPLGSYYHLFREIGKGSDGYLTKVGLGSFVDPRLRGGRINPSAKEEWVELVNFRGEEYLYYKSFPVNVAIIKGTTADQDGNISFEEEALKLTPMVYVMAAKASGGIVIAQVKQVLDTGHIRPAHLVEVPGALVDAIVVDKDQRQNEFFPGYDARASGQMELAVPPIAPWPLNEDKIIARRAMLEVKRGWIINLGARVPAQVFPMVALEENIQDLISLTIEHGAFGGINLGSHIHQNPTSFWETDRLFDFYESGALDAAFVAGGEVNAKGDWNTSYLGGSLFGAGGLTSIVHSTKRIFVFCKFTRGGLKTKSGDGKLHIIQEGKVAKWIRNISDVTASGEYRLKHGQQVKYITERGVFRLEPRGIVLEEIAPGVDLRHDILERAEFEIFVDDNLKEMDRRIFLDQPMGMRDILLSQ